jgi:hypothetical protein
MDDVRRSVHQAMRWTYINPKLLLSKHNEGGQDEKQMGSDKTKAGTHLI